jgi:predicted metal-dependent enzyme (double-stranded beta helix superfamily)
LDNLICDIHSVVANEPDPDQVASRVALALRPYLGSSRLLAPEQCEPDPVRYRQHVLYVPEDGSFSLVALVWLPGQATSVHDHVSWCVVGVHQGLEQEVQFQLVERDSASYLLPVGTCANPVGSVSALNPPGDIHSVVNPGPGLAISLHVYGADVRQTGSSIRRRYDQPVLPEEGWHVA